jgi:hypothetical protein
MTATRLAFPFFCQRRKLNNSWRSPLKRIALPLLAIILVTLACGTSSPVVPTSTSQPVTGVPVHNPNFTISVEYGILGVAQTYADAGVAYSKIQDAFAIWGNIEPQPGQYQWGPLDALVLEYQQAGFTGLQMDLTALSPWASSIPPALGTAPKDVDTFPKEEFLDDYAAYVASVVERYDHDGKDDMPGLLYPIHDYGIEREFTGYWPGTAEEYVRLVRIAYPAIKAADPEANVLLVALLMADIFDGNPTPAEIQQRLARNADYMRKSVPEIRVILAACDAYDMVDFHALGNYTEIPLTAAWIHQELQANGCGEKPIWIGDAFPMSRLVGYGGFVPPTPFAPVTLETREAVVKLLQAVADPSEPGHDTDQTWLYAETAIGLTRKLVVSAGKGLRGINIGNLEDWKTGISSVDKAAVPMLGASMFMGLTDTTITNEKPGGTLAFNGQDWSKARLAGDLRPAWYALALVTEKIGQFTAVKQLDLGTDIWAYRFETPSGPVQVLWYDDYTLYLPGETPPSVSVSLPFETASALLTFTPTTIGRTELEIYTLEISNGNLTFDLGSTPVFVQGMP